MSEQPNPKMDDLLKRYARQRRAEAGAPVELDSPTRQLLQAEVARHFTKAQGERSAGLVELLNLWPRVLAGVAAAGVLLCVGVIWFVREDRRELAETRAQESNLFFCAQSQPGMAPTAGPVDGVALPGTFRGLEQATASDEQTPAEAPGLTPALATTPETAQSEAPAPAAAT